MKLYTKQALCLLVALFLLPLSVLANVTEQSLRQGNPADDVEVKPTLELSPLETEALKLLEQGKLKEAHELLQSSIKTDQGKSADLNYLLSVFQWKEQKYKDCARSLTAVLDALKKDKRLDDRQNVLLLKRIADCYYQERDLDKSGEFYRRALEISSSSLADDRISLSILENLIGSLQYGKQYEEAEKYSKLLVDKAHALAKRDEISYMAMDLWAQLQLLNIYRTRGKEEERQKLRKETAELLDRLMTLRADLDEAGKIPEMDKFRKVFLKEYIKENQPQTLAEYLWLAQEYRPHSLPLIEWRSRKDQQTKAVLLCIHGLGLDNTAFGPFGKAMASRGFTVYAMDVRGFGSWLSIPGQEDVGFSDALKDIQGVVKLLRERHPKKPIYLIGESMGGGIVLRAGAQFGKIVDGIIASVPSAERFQEKKMGLTVAVHLLRDHDRPFNIGHTVATQATTNEALKNAWEESFKSKMKMTPVELMKFAVFMRTTLRKCKDIKETPVFLVQGLKDRLVKPQGTFKMFDAVKSEDKILFIVGTAEHLILENDSQSEILLDSLCSWLNEHNEQTQ